MVAHHLHVSAGAFRTPGGLPGCRGCSLDHSSAGWSESGREGIRGDPWRARACGVLIVSEFAGCSVELTDALPTNPYDITEMASTLQQALLMDEREQAERMH